MDLATIDRLSDLEAAMLDADGQVEIETTHHFLPGIYVREIFLPEGTLAIGHTHKGPCGNMLLKGTMRVLVNGEVKEITAPYVFTSGPGRKVAYAVTDCVFQNLHATEETDLERLEEQLIEKSDVWQAHQLENAALLLKGE